MAFKDIRFPDRHQHAHDLFVEVFDPKVEIYQRWAALSHGEFP